MHTKRARIIAGAWIAVGCALLAGCADKPEALIANAKSALEKNDRSAAMIQLKNALQIDPDLGEARYLLGKAQLDAGDMAAAEKELRKAQELKVSDDLVVPPLARTMVARGEFKRAVDEFGKVELSVPGARAELATALAQAQFALRNIDAARAGFAAALQADPSYAPAMLGEAGLKALSGDVPGAVAIVDKALAASPKLAEAWLMKGDLAVAQAQTDAALAAYNKTLELRPDYVGAHSKVVSLLLREGKTQEASAQVAAMKKVAPQHPQTFYAQALLAYRDKNFPAAREAIQLQLRVLPDNVPGLVLQGNIEYQSGSFAQAETSLRKALQKAPNQRSARLMLVSTYVRVGQPAKALETLKPLLDDPNPSADILALAGEVYMRNGNAKEAERAFAKAAALDPNDSRKRTALALTHVSAGETDRGVRELEEVAAADSGSRADLALVATYMQQRKYDEALKAVDALAKKQPDKALPHTLRGSVLAAKGDSAGARQSFERALAVDPADFGAAASLARFDVADKKPEAARKRFESVLAKDPKNVRAFLAIAELSALSGSTSDEVAALIAKAVAADPTSVAPRRILINHHLRSKEPKKAVAAAQDALAAIPDRAELLEAAGLAQIAAGDPNQALAMFGKLAQAMPQAPEPHIHMARAQLAAKDADGAVQSLKKALALKPELVSVQRAMAKLDLEAGRDSDALLMAREVQKQRPKESVGYALEGDIHVAKKAWAPAVAAYRNGLKNANTPDLAVRLDAVLRERGTAAEAESFAATWLREHPKDRMFRFYLAEMAMGKKDYARAAAQYKSMLEIRPDDWLALNNLAWVAGQLNDPKALEYAERASKLAPGNPAVLDTYGTLLVASGDTARGLPLLQKAVAIAPGAANVRLNLARALLKAGQQDAAKAELETLAKLGNKFPGHAEVARLRGEAPAQGEVAKGAEDAVRDVERLQRALAAAPNAAAIRLKLAQAMIKAGQTGEARKELETLAKLGSRFSEQAEVARLMQSL